MTDLGAEVRRLRAVNAQLRGIIASADERYRRIANLPEQPDGIEDDSQDMPEPMAAARRVIEFVAEFGDGLYDARNGKPLYGRDLEALCRQVLG